MKLLKANNHEQAFKELSEIDKKAAKKLSSEIKESDKRMYHSIGVKIETVANSAKNKVVLQVIKHHKHGFERFSKDFQLHGFMKIIVLHNPENLEEKEEKHIPQHIKTATRSEIEKELREKFDAELEEKVAAGIAKKMEVIKNEETNESSEVEIEFATAISGKKDDLLAYALKYGIEMTEKEVNNDDRIKKITAWFNDRMS